VVEKNREIVELIQVTVTVLCEDSSEVLDSGVEVVNVLEWLVI
jgi:hypothetical protein